MMSYIKDGTRPGIAFLNEQRKNLLQIARWMDIWFVRFLRTFIYTFYRHGD